MIEALLENQRRTHKCRSSIYFCKQMCQYWPITKELNQLCTDTGCNLRDLPGAMDDRYGWREIKKEREREREREGERVNGL